MTSSDWTTPEAYLGRMIPAPRKRSIASEIALRFRVWLRAELRDRQKMTEYEELRRMGRDLPNYVRRDIGLPPYDHP